MPRGALALVFVVRNDGSVGDVRILRTLGSGLDERAVQAVRQWRFSPAERQGQPVDVIVEVGEINHVTVGALLFDADGTLVGRTRSRIEAETLEPGGTSKFLLTMSDVDAVSRYRVGFRIDERIVPHVDRRTRGTMVPTR